MTRSSDHAGSDAPPAGPRLRGLNPAALVSLLDPSPAIAPAIPGWEIENIVGEGGLGFVWRARRMSDGVIAALKVPRLADVDHIERIEQEAGMLRALSHPHIVRLLETGPTEESGIYLAMEFIDGPSLAQVIPSVGFASMRAFELFDEISGAVMYAHSQGVLHRDLKPGNILIDAKRKAHIADFGLARPVHERVQHLSLTQTGLVAGTFEYLPPEAYHANYTPTVQGDVFALGVILYELLTGSPPRGAWHPVSQQKRIDIRVDDVLRRALDPDCGARWRSVAEMRRALAEIQGSAPRYSGAPLVTGSIRAVDFFWTALGLLILLAAIGVDMKMGLTRVPWPIDLVGPHALRTGGAQALWWLSLALAPVALWQILRLWRFRAVPLREALPSPFGLRLGTSRTAAALIAIAQFCCLILPALLLLDIFHDSTTEWINPGDPAWRAGLLVTKWESDAMISPWSWPEKKAHYWLKEFRGVPGDPLARQLDRVDFYPGVMPWSFTAAAGAIAFALVGTVLAAAVRWWHRRRAHSILVISACALSSAAVLWPLRTKLRPSRITEEQQKLRYQIERRDDKSTYALLCDDLVRTLYSNPPPDAETIERKVLVRYASEVEFRDRGKVPNTEVSRSLVNEAGLARQYGRSASILNMSWMPDDSGIMDTLFLHHRSVVLMFTEPRGTLEAEGNWLTVTLVAVTSPEIGAIHISQERDHKTRLYRAPSRELSQAEAAEWSNNFVAALRQIPVPGAEDPLGPLLTPNVYIANDGWRAEQHEQRLFTRKEYTAFLRASAFKTPSFSSLTIAAPPAPAEAKPGARQRIDFWVSSGSTPMRWQADLVFEDGQWRAVSVRF